MKLRVIVEDEEGNVIAETSRLVNESVFEGNKVLIHPGTSDLVYEVLDEAEDALNNGNNF